MDLSYIDPQASTKIPFQVITTIIDLEILQRAPNRRALRFKNVTQRLTKHSQIQAFVTFFSNRSKKIS